MSQHWMPIDIYLLEPPQGTLCQVPGQCLTRHLPCQDGYLARPKRCEVSAALLLRLGPQWRQGRHRHWELRRRARDRPGFAGQPVDQGACRPPREYVGQHGRPCVPQGVAIQRRRRCLGTEQVSGPDLHPCGAEREGGRDPATISDPTGGDNRHSDGINDLRYQRERAGLWDGPSLAVRSEERTPVSPRLVALSDDGIGAMRFQPAGLLNCRRR